MVILGTWWWSWWFVIVELGYVQCCNSMLIALALAPHQNTQKVRIQAWHDAVSFLHGASPFPELSYQTVFYRQGCNKHQFSSYCISFVQFGQIHYPLLNNHSIVKGILWWYIWDALLGAIIPVTVILNTDSLMWDKGRSCAYAFCLQSQFQNGSVFLLLFFFRPEGDSGKRQGLSACDKLKLFYTTPVVIFILNCVSVSTLSNCYQFTLL